MPIASTTVVTKVKKNRASGSSKQNERRVKEKIQKEVVEDQDNNPPLFEIKESKYHEDIFARE